MLVKFSSVKTEPLIMFGDIAVQLIKAMGASGSIPGGIRAEDIPAAIARLQQLSVPSALSSEQGTHPNHDEDRDREPPLALATRAVPLIDLLERAAEGHVTLMWEAM